MAGFTYTPQGLVAPLFQAAYATGNRGQAPDPALGIWAAFQAAHQSDVIEQDKANQLLLAHETLLQKQGQTPTRQAGAPTATNRPMAQSLLDQKNTQAEKMQQERFAQSEKMQDTRLSQSDEERKAAQLATQGRFDTTDKERQQIDTRQKAEFQARQGMASYDKSLADIKKQKAALDMGYPEMMTPTRKGYAAWKALDDQETDLADKRSKLADQVQSGAIFGQQQTGEAAQQLTPDIAKQLYEKAGRDPQKARELAKQMGYQIG